MKWLSGDGFPDSSTAGVRVDVRAGAGEEDRRAPCVSRDLFQRLRAGAQAVFRPATTADPERERAAIRRRPSGRRRKRDA
ncbi:hypothetical protein WS62_17955 [Burkholderia sp. ABCPW 14]|nr:hypothetical protein WS62_17955 [Burkholderia sp. ABCPW 14]